MSFARRGVATLVIAKFVPGLDTLAPPLAGALGMRAQSFAIFNAAGAALWAGANIAGGLIFHVQIQHLLGSLSELGRMAVWLVAALVAVYVAWRMARRWRELRLHARMPRVHPDELAEMIEQGRELLILDVRTQGPGLPLRETHLQGTTHRSGRHSDDRLGEQRSNRHLLRLSQRRVCHQGGGPAIQTGGRREHSERWHGRLGAGWVPAGGGVTSRPLAPRDFRSHFVVEATA